MRAGAVRGRISQECSQLHRTADPTHSDLNKGNTFPSLERHPEAGKPSKQEPVKWELKVKGNSKQRKEKM